MSIIDPPEPIPTKDLKGSAENIFANGVGELSLTFIDVHGDEQVLWRRSIQQLPVQPPASSSSNSEEKTEENADNAEDNSTADAPPAEPVETVATVVVEGLNYIRPPDPLPEPEPEAEEDDEDAE